MSREVQVENRSIILSYISDNPGSHLRKIARNIDISLSTLRYHLDYLEKKGEISCQKQSNLKVYFLSDKLKPHEKMLTPILQQKHYRDIILALIEAPGLTFSQIADKLSMGNSSASKYINHLEDQKILFHRKSGREKSYYLRDEKSIIDLLNTYKRFAEDVSFEVRTPMNTIMGMASLLLEGELTPEQRDFVETIKISGEALIAMVNDFLDFSKIDREKIELNIQTFYLHLCIEGAIDSVASEAAEKRLNLAYLIDKTTPYAIIGDPKRLHQILVSLLSNAIDSIKEPNGDVLISVSSDLFDTHYETHFAIRYADMGSSAQELCEPLELSPKDNAEKSINPLTEKRNLKRIIETRLNLSKKLVQLMGGSIWEERPDGVESAIHFTIKAKPAHRASPLAGIQPLLNGKRILIIEGNKDNRHVLGMQSQEWGMMPVTAGSYQDYIKISNKGESFDIAVLDINIPETEITSLVEVIRKYDKTPPLIALKFRDQHDKPDLFSASLIRPIKLSSFHRGLMSAISGQPISEKDQIPIEAVVGVQAPSGAAVCPKSMHILVAEDNTPNQRVMLAMLERLGYKADTANNGTEVLQALEHRPYDMILMDVKMPLMDGIETTREIHHRWPSDSPKIIAITAYAFAGDREKCLEAGMDDYISKPVEIGELTEVLKKHGP
jgi:CheY-like chemotaxis protein/signal transduction histidine kinase